MSWSWATGDGEDTEDTERHRETQGDAGRHRGHAGLSTSPTGHVAEDLALVRAEFQGGSWSKSMTKEEKDDESMRIWNAHCIARLRTTTAEDSRDAPGGLKDAKTQTCQMINVRSLLDVLIVSEDEGRNALQDHDETERTSHSKKQVA